MEELSPNKVRYLFHHISALAETVLPARHDLTLVRRIASQRALQTSYMSSAKGRRETVVTSACVRCTDRGSRCHEASRINFTRHKAHYICDLYISHQLNYFARLPLRGLKEGDSTAPWAEIATALEKTKPEVIACWIKIKDLYEEGSRDFIRVHQNQG